MEEKSQGEGTMNEKSGGREESDMSRELTGVRLWGPAFCVGCMLNNAVHLLKKFQY